MAQTLLTADTSLVVPFLSQWHPAHAQAVAALKPVLRLPGHVLVEVVSSMTRLPRSRVSPEVASRVVLEAFPGAPLTLQPEEYRSFVRELGQASLAGGAIYDALVAAAARAGGARLLSRDRRAERTYRAMGVDFEMVG